MVDERPKHRPRESAFVGRAHELDLLFDAIAGLKSGRGALFLLSGEPGIGKTRLAEEVSSRTERDGMTVVWGAAWDGGGAPAYWPWIQILRGLRGVVPEPGDGLRRDLGALWGDAAERQEEELEAREFRRYDALRAVLAIAAERRPLVLVLDDLHAADRGTLAALHFLSRVLRTLPVLILGTHRDAEVRQRPEIGVQLDRIARDGARLELGRLRREDVAELTRHLEPVSVASVDRIFEASGGNPFFATELLRLMRTGAGAKRVPDAVRAVVAERVRALDARAREVLEAMAVVGREASLETLSSVCRSARHELEEQLAGVVLSGIVERIEADRYAFSHPLFRESLYDGVLPARRCRLHLCAADALSRTPAPTPGHSESLARHLLLGLPEGDLQRAVEQARAAARGCVLELGFDRAVELLELARSALGDAPDEELSCDLELELAEALTLVGAGERSRAICASVAARAGRRADAARLSRAALVYGSEIRVAVVDPLQLELLQNALELVGSTDVRLRAKLLARLAAARQPNPDPQSPVAQAFEAIALARSTNDPDALIQALYTGGAALTGYAPPLRRREVSSELAELALERRDLVRAQRGYARWALDAAELGDALELGHAIRAEERLGRTLGHPSFRWQSALLGSMHALIEGRWSDSERLIEEAEGYVAELEAASARNTLSIHRICALRARMKAPATLPQEDPTFGSDAELGRAMRLLGAASYYARLGEHAVARSTFERALPLPAFLPLIPSALALAAEAAARVESVDETRRFLPHLAALPFPAITWGATAFSWEGFLTDLVGRSELVLGNFDAAVESLERAIDAEEAFGARPAALDARIALAAALLGRRSSKDAEQALFLLETAEAAARQLDMPGPLRRIERLRREPALDCVPPVAPAMVSRSTAFTLQREGEVWRFTSGERTAHLKHSRALEMLKALVDHPGREFHVLELASGADPGTAVDLGDSGEAVDTASASAYRARAQELRSELEEARRWNDAARCERIRTELDFLEDELCRNVGLGGRPRRVAGAAERARVNVHKRLKGVIRRLSAELPELAEHLEKSIATGFSVIYRPR